VAIKQLDRELIDRQPDALARFVREGEILRQLQHPNIVGILGTYEHNGQYALVMEYVAGGSLRTLINSIWSLGVMLFELMTGRGRSRVRRLRRSWRASWRRRRMSSNFRRGLARCWACLPNNASSASPACAR
jgi:serine/threonine protein kinase